VCAADIQTEPPTPDQLGSILEYLGPSKAGSVVKDATGSTDALRKFNASPNVFQRPVVVDWNNGRAGMSSGFDHWMRSIMRNQHIEIRR
jgi:arsenate reductase-like glutaredoxin family protein